MTKDQRHQAVTVWIQRIQECCDGVAASRRWWAACSSPGSTGTSSTPEPMSEADPQRPEPTLSRLLGELTSLEALADNWDEGARNGAQARSEALDALNAEAIRRRQRKSPVHKHRAFSVISIEQSDEIGLASFAAAQA